MNITNTADHRINVDKLMKAAIADKPGEAEELQFRKIERPVIIAPDEVLVHVSAISINPVDVLTRSKTYFGVFPNILGVDFSGVIESIGTEVNRFKMGDRVAGLRPSPREAGTYAEFIVIRELHIALIPQSITFEVAAALPVAGLTAFQGLYYDLNIKKNERILIHGGAGGVGSFAIQLAKRRGTYIFTTASPSNFDFVKSLGADEVLDYHKKDFSKARGVDYVLDTVSGESQELSLPLIKRGGVLLSILPYPIRSERIVNGEIRVFNRNVHASGSDLERLIEYVSRGEVLPVIHEIIPFSEIAYAHKLLSKPGIRGKIIVNELH